MTRQRLEVFDEEHAASRLRRDLPHWRIEGGQIRRVFRTSGWKGSLLAAGAIGHLAEVAWHHPDLLITYGKVEVRLSTHDHQGITERDFALAAKIEDVIAWHPAADGPALEGTPADPKFAYIKPDVSKP